MIKHYPLFIIVLFIALFNHELKAQSTENISPAEQKFREKEELRLNSPIVYQSLSPRELEKIRQEGLGYRDLAPGESPEEYIVQPGDTLYDIADQLLDDAQWWPRLWVLNPQLESPESLEPGMKLQFYPKGNRIPNLVVRDDLESVVPISFAMYHKLGGEKLKDSSKDILNNTFIPIEEVEVEKEYFTYGNPEAASPTAVMFTIPGFASTEEPEYKGKILEELFVPLLSNMGNLTYAQFVDKPKPGQTFLTIRPSAIESAGPDGKENGYKIYSITGQIGVLNTYENNVTQVYVEQATEGISPGDLIIPFRKTEVMVDFSKTNEAKNVDTTVVGVQDGPYLMAGTYQVVHLKKVTGIQIGDDILLHMNSGGMMFFEETSEYPKIQAARARVIDVTQESVSAVLLNAYQEVTIGATTKLEKRTLNDIPTSGFWFKNAWQTLSLMGQ